MLRMLNVFARSHSARARIRASEILAATKGLEDVDSYDLFFTAAMFFGAPTTRQEVRAYLGMDLGLPREQYVREFKHKWTWEGLARFLLAKLGAVPIEEATVFGRRCGPAGAFLAIERITEELDGGAAFPPSERIARQLSGQRLVNLWERLQWLCRRRLPRLRRMWLFNRGYDLILCGVLSGLISTCAGLAFVLPFAALAVILGLSLRAIGPGLPDGVATFRDLAYAVWERRVAPSA
jgi:hypothetical protein